MNLKLHIAGLLAWGDLTLNLTLVKESLTPSYDARDLTYSYNNYKSIVALVPCTLGD